MAQHMQEAASIKHSNCLLTDNGEMHLTDGVMCIIVEKSGLSSIITCASTVKRDFQIPAVCTHTWCISDFKEPIILKSFHIHGKITKGRKYFHFVMHHFYFSDQNTVTFAFCLFGKLITIFK